MSLFLYLAETSLPYLLETSLYLHCKFGKFLPESLQKVQQNHLHILSRLFY